MIKQNVSMKFALVLLFAVLLFSFYSLAIVDAGLQAGAEAADSRKVSTRC